MTQEKLPPYSEAAEAAVIGSLLVDGDAINEIVSTLRPDDFFTDQHRWLYEGCLSLYRRSVVISEITLAHELGDKLSPAGGAAYLCHLISIVPTPFHVKYYADIIIRTATRRRLINAGGEITRLGFQDDPDIDKALEKASRALANVRQTTGKGLLTPKDIAQRMDAHVGDLRYHSGASCSYGVGVLDANLYGMRKGQYIVLGSETGQGKTALCRSIARNVQKDVPVFYVSTEMLCEELGEQELASLTSLPIKMVLAGNYSDADHETLVSAAAEMGEQHIYLHEPGRITTESIKAGAYRMQQTVGLGLIIVDYLQQLQDEVGKTIYENTRYCSRTLKIMAMSLGVPILTVAQLNRNINQMYGRKDGKKRIPELSDFRDAGTIEQDADVGLLMYRVYKEKGYDAAVPNEFSTMINIAKFRQGDKPDAPVTLTWNGLRRCYE